MPALHLIYAQAHNRVIGYRGSMPWHLPEDLAHFKRTTIGHPVIMGRKTWDSLPAAFRPLQGRRNIVVTRQTQWSAQGAETVHSLQQALDACDSHEQVWLIGGAQLYAQAIPIAQQIVVTEIDKAVQGDAFAPELSTEIWQPIETGQWQQSTTGVAYRFITYARTTNKVQPCK